MGCCTLTINAILAYYFHTYSQESSNPDGYRNCWTAGDGTVSSSQFGNAENVGAEMRTWFWYGFVIMSTSSVYSLMTFVYQAQRSEFISSLTHCIGSIQVLAWIIWLIAGTVVRFSDAGEVCSGSGAVTDGTDPFMTHSGKFMYSYIITMYVLLGLMCCCGCCAGAALAGGFIGQQ